MTGILVSVTIMLIIFVIVTGIVLSQDNTLEAIQEMWSKKYDTKREIELRRLDVLEKTPELRQLIFHPKKVEKDD